MKLKEKCNGLLLLFAGVWFTLLIVSKILNLLSDVLPVFASLLE